MNVFLGDHLKIFICRRCLNSYANENALRNHKEKCGDDNICTIRTSSVSHTQLNKHCYENPSCFEVYADFEVDNEINTSTKGNKTTNNYRQNPVPNGYHIHSELNDFLPSGYPESLLCHNNVEWFVNKILKLESKMTLYFKITNKDIIMTKKDKEDYRNINICRFCEKK